MSSKRLAIRHYFGGGFASDYGPSADVPPNQGGAVLIPFLTKAQNVFFELDGGPHKIGGTSKLNSVVIESGQEIRGMIDYWRQGTTGSPVQKRVAYAGTKILADAADGTFVVIKSGLEDDKVPCLTVFNDALILSSDSTVDVPMTYDQTTVSNLGGTPPQFSFSCVHKNHVWAAGVAAFPSRLYYCKTLDANDWTHATAGSIDIDPDDGDHITAIASHKNNLWVFKGPYKGSIHRITGSANTGTDSFARIPFISGLGAVAHNLLFRMRDDLGFVWSDGTVHSLAATAAYGDFNEAALSRPMHRWIFEHANTLYLHRGWAVTDVQKSWVLFTIPTDTNVFPDQILLMDYSRQSGVWWSIIPAYDAASLARVIDQTDSNRPVIVAGGSDGFIRKTNRANRAIDDSTAIVGEIATPFNNYGSSIMMKTLAEASVGIAPKGAYNLTFGWVQDDGTGRTVTLDQGGGDVLGPATANQFTLDTSALGGALYVDRFTELGEEGGEFRSLAFSLYNAGLNEDFEVHSVSAFIEPGAYSTEASS